MVFPNVHRLSDMVNCLSNLSTVYPICQTSLRFVTRLSELLLSKKSIQFCCLPVNSSIVDLIIEVVRRNHVTQFRPVFLDCIVTWPGPSIRRLHSIISVDWFISLLLQHLNSFFLHLSLALFLMRCHSTRS